MLKQNEKSLLPIFAFKSPVDNMRTQIPAHWPKVEAYCVTSRAQLVLELQPSVF